jgi:thiol-disulfide isomerase/thioredoxin
MSILWAVPLLLSTAMAERYLSPFVRIDISGMTCVACEQKVIKNLNNLSFLDATRASTPLGAACADIKGGFNPVTVTEAIEELGYTIDSINLVQECDLSVSQLPKNWHQTDDLDVQIISTGEEVTLENFIAPEKYTIYDFGAPWCAPCHAAEQLLKIYMAEHSDVAVRAIVLDSPNPKESFAMPATKQHLMSAPGLPYFILMNPNGKTIYRGTQIDKLLKKMDKHR